MWRIFCRRNIASKIGAGAIFDYVVGSLRKQVRYAKGFLPDAITLKEKLRTTTDPALLTKLHRALTNDYGDIGITAGHLPLASRRFPATFAGYANFIRTPAFGAAAFGQLLWDDGTRAALAARGGGILFYR